MKNLIVIAVLSLAALLCFGQSDRYAPDVPAIKEVRIIPEDERPNCKPMTCPTAKSCMVSAVCFPPDDKKTVSTCADKSRVLLTAEDGKQWCHKINQGGASFE